MNNDLTKKIIKDNVKIGGENYQVEYIKFDNNSRIGNLKELTLWDKITIPFCRIKYRVQNVFWKIHYGFERMIKGYDSVDTFDLFSNFIERYYKILTKYKENLHGHPIQMTETEWNNIIDKMIYHLYLMNEENVYKELSKNVSNEWIPCYKTVYEIMEKHKNEFFILFSKYFYDLWD